MPNKMTPGAHIMFRTFDNGHALFFSHNESKVKVSCRGKTKAGHYTFTAYEVTCDDQAEPRQRRLISVGLLDNLCRIKYAELEKIEARFCEYGLKRMCKV